MNNRKTAVNFDSIGNFQSFTVLPRTEQKKEFSTMFEILRDAEKYDQAGEEEVCKSMLETLKKYIDKYDSEQEDIQSFNDRLIKNMREKCENTLVKPEFQQDRPNTTSELNYERKIPKTNESQRSNWK